MTATSRFPQGLVYAMLLASSALIPSCSGDRRMADTAEMPDSMEVLRAIEDPDARAALLDTMPGGEMVEGNSAAESNLLHDKMP